MPIINRQDAAEVEQYITGFFAAPPTGRAQALRRLFVEKLDFAGATGTVSLANAPKNVALPASAERIASMEGLHVVYVPLSGNGPDRVRRAEASAAAKLIADALHGDLLLVMTNPSGSQLHIIYPTFVGATPSLRRMIIERDLPRRTAVQQLSNIFWLWKDTGTIRMAVDRAFDVEAVTKDFFEEYKRVFERALATVQGFGPSEEEQESKKLFVQTLFNRLMFIYFLSRKGWLTFNGDKDYLNALWRAHEARPDENKNFYVDRLRLLFFAGLNNPNSQDLTSESESHRLLGIVPFLNGGLFDRTDEDNRTRVLVPDEAIDQILRQLFDRFNFTVMESTPFDIEVAVDPEMLGKVFEELVTGRHESGSYYTPRPVVAFMCREALKGYLQGAIPSLPPDAIGQFVDQRDVSGLNLTTAGMVRRALEQIKVVDPACGSGAYLLGILHELVDLETVLYNEKLVMDPKSLYELKLRIIEENVYGADIDQFAVNVAMLRLWLSLSIEYDRYPPLPLPNLDFKIVRGDSLTAPDPNPSVHGAQYQMFREQVHAASGRLAKLKHQYMNAVDQPKRTLAAEIQKEQATLSQALAFAPAPNGAVDWRVTFAEVFDLNGGFDIAIANPPYRRMEGLSQQKDDLRRLYPTVFAPRADYHVYFYNRSVQLLRDGGELSFITSNKYMRAAYGENIRGFLPNALTLGRVIDFGDLPIFKASAYPAIVVGRKAKPPEGHALDVADVDVPVRRALLSEGKAVTVDTVFRAMERLPYFLDDYGVKGYPQVLLKRDGWILEDPALVRLFERLMAQGTPLDEYVKGRIYMGVKTGLNKAFVIDQAKRDELVRDDPNSAEIIKQWLEGKDIRRWRTEWRGLYVIFASRGVQMERYPAVIEHLTWFRPQLEKRATAHLHPWYELQQPQEGIYSQFSLPKAIWPQMNPPSAMQFAFDAQGFFVNQKTFVMPGIEPWLVGFVNSNVIHWIAEKLCTKLQNGWLELNAKAVIGRLPIIEPDTSTKAIMARIASSGGDEKTLNDIVYSILKVTPSERDLVAEWVAKQATAYSGEVINDEDHE